MRLGTPDPDSGWLNDDELEHVRRRVPIVYVEAIPLRVDGGGEVEHLGLLLRANADGVMTRAFVSGRVRYGESIREALLRHLEKDLGSMALPQLPPAIAPFTVAEYTPFPWSRLTDERQHAVSLVFLVPVSGECDPRRDALEITWITPEDALDPDLLDELEGGREAVLKTAIGHLGRWP